MLKKSHASGQIEPCSENVENLKSCFYSKYFQLGLVIPPASSLLPYNSYQPGRVMANMFFLWNTWGQTQYFFIMLLMLCYRAHAVRKFYPTSSTYVNMHWEWEVCSVAHSIFWLFWVFIVLGYQCTTCYHTCYCEHTYALKIVSVCMKLHVHVFVLKVCIGTGIPRNTF